ncbi:aspartate:alanine exchanger family transporter [Arcanobacterium hippocoleae]|uniref:Transport protein n=1 Tax=Arcanobacterium hippocoleae TaxID=149017 RepID=A0ABU1T1F1_9ACTO|nr:TrkA C-terminal domain-containing protein [Arcanobacterium hippocoleae]MDR6939194.1 putative transport protein [Arcanobacterium hippocoleae]
MSIIFNALAENQVLLLFILIGIGITFSWVRVKGISLGAAAVLFFSIILTAWALADGYEIKVEHDLGVLGLALFAFAIGISSGPRFFNTLRSAIKPVIFMILAFVLAAGAAAGIGSAMGMSWAMIAGTFSGAVTNTPALAAAGSASGDPATATVGYAIAYLFGVIGMLIWSAIALSKAKSDIAAQQEIKNRTIRVERADQPKIAEILSKLGPDVKVSRIRHGEVGPIYIPTPDDILFKDDLVTVVGPENEVKHAIELMGHGSSHSLLENRHYLDFRRITLSNAKLSGLTVAELNIEQKFGGTISRIRRGDTDIMATPDEPVYIGDRVRVIAPTHSMKKISGYFGDSSRGLTDINPFALGIGMALGIMIGEFKFLTPSGLTFSIGSAAGTLIVGLIMGKIGRIGKLITTIPFTTCQVLSELGLLIFLAYAGTTAGSQILNAFTGGAWIQIFILGAIITSIVGAALYFSLRLFTNSPAMQIAGSLGGAQTQPAVLAFANDRTKFNPQVALGYAMVYPVAMIAKIFIAQVLGAFAGM